MNPDNFGNLLDQILASSQQVAADILKMVFNSLWSSLSPYWPYLVLAFFILVIIATIKLLCGQWGAMGSLIFNVIYFGVISVIVIIAGINILLNPIFDLICAILYPVSYRLTGLILRKIR